MFKRISESQVHLRLRSSRPHAWKRIGTILVERMDNRRLDGCIVLNEHNTVLGSKHLAICANVYVGVQK